MIYDEVKIEFSDGTNDIIYIPEDDDLQEAVVDHCERTGWNVNDVTNYHIVKSYEQVNGDMKPL